MKPSTKGEAASLFNVLTGLWVGILGLGTLFELFTRSESQLFAVIAGGCGVIAFIFDRSVHADLREYEQLTGGTDDG